MRRLAVFALLVFFAASVKAQFDAATVLGTVTDPSGAVVAHSQVALRNTATAAVANTITDDQGQFRFVDVPIGSYKLEVSAQGFQPSSARFELTVGARQRVDVKLGLASVATSVEATAVAAQLETESSEHSQVVDERQIAELPLNGREYSQLVELSTGVVPSPSQTTVGYDQREGSFNVNGLRSTYNNFLLDGLDNNQYGTSNQGFSNQVVQLSPDAVAEFSVVTNNMSAEYGHSGGATINAVTRFGTNQFHGRAWDYLRNTALNAEGFFKPDVGGKPAMRRNQFGATLGGPIKRDKAFFFVDYEGYRELSSTTDQATIPTYLQRGYDASGTTALGYYTITDEATGNALPVNNPCPYAYGSNICTSSTGLAAGLLGATYNPYHYGANYANGEIPTSAVTPFAAKVLTMLPAPTNSYSTNNYVVLHAVTNNRDKGDIKIDYTPNQSLRYFARFSKSRADVFDPGTISGTAGGDGDGHVEVPIIDVAGGATWTISPVSVLDVRLGFSQTNSGKTPVLSGGQSMYDMFGLTGLPTDTRYTGGITYQDFNSGGFTSLGREATSPQYQHPTVWNPKVNFSRLLARHTIKTGVEFTNIHVAQEDLHPVLGADVYAAQISGLCYNNYATYNALGEQLVGYPLCAIANGTGSTSHGTASSTTTKMYEFADFLFGYRYELGLASPHVANIREWGWAGYLQDDIKVNNRLTLNLGLRYEFYTPIHEANNYLSNYIKASSTSGSMKVASSSDRYLVDPNTRDFAPRFGAAFSLDPHTVLRGGFGISYTHWNRVGSNYLTQNAPYGIVALRLVYPGQANYRNTQLGYPTDLVDSSSYKTTEAVAQYMPVNSPDTQVRAWFLSLQRDLGHSWLFDLSYVGNNGLNEVIINDINQAAVQSSATASASTQSRRPNQSYGSIIGTLPWGTSNYNGLQAKIEKRFSDGIYLLNSFTWSKAIDVTSQSLDGGGNCSMCGNAIPSVQDINNWKADRTTSAYDHPIVNTTSVVWSLPLGQGQRYLNHLSGFWNQILGNWQMTNIFQALSGDPLTFGYSPDSQHEVSSYISIYGRNAYRPNQSGHALAASKSYKQYFNTAAFSIPDADVVFGNSPRNAVRGYTFWQLDTGLTKDFALTKGTRFQFRAESFNLTNRTNFGDPDSKYGDTNFGVITTARPAREFQFAGKIIF